MTIAGGNANATGTTGYGVWASHVGGPGLFTSNPCHVDVGDPFRILIDLSAGASLITPFAFDLPMPGAEGSASARAAASFPANGPVFELPVGYTASSAAAQVVSNGYVPEPGPGAGAGVACAGLLAVRTRLRRQTSRSTRLRCSSTKRR
jgi:hypothetical protein